MMRIAVMRDLEVHREGSTLKNIQDLHIISIHHETNCAVSLL